VEMAALQSGAARDDDDDEAHVHNDCEFHYTVTINNIHILAGGHSCHVFRLSAYNVLHLGNLTLHFCVILFGVVQLLTTQTQQYNTIKTFLSCTVVDC